MLDLPLARRSRLVGKPQLARRPSLAGEKPWWQPNSRVEIAKRDNVFTARALKQIIAELPTVGRVHKHVRLQGSWPNGSTWVRGCLASSRIRSVTGAG